MLYQPFRNRGGRSVTRIMKAVVYHGPGKKAWEEVPKPIIDADTDAIVRVDAVTICGSDLHILKGDVPAVTDGRILVPTGYEVGVLNGHVQPGDVVAVVGAGPIWSTPLQRRRC